MIIARFQFGQDLFLEAIRLCLTAITRFYDHQFPHRGLPYFLFQSPHAFFAQARQFYGVFNGNPDGKQKDCYKPFS